MAYLGATELTNILPQNVNFDASSVPLTLGEVATIIYEVGAELDAAAAVAGYLVPVTASVPEAYALMQRWTKFGAAAQVLRIIFPTGQGQANQNTLASDYRDAYKAALAGLAASKVILPGAPTDTSSANRELPRSFSTTNSTATVGVTPHVDMDWEP